MAMSQHLNVLMPDMLMASLNAWAAARGVTRSQAARLAMAGLVLDRSPYLPPALPNWRTEAYTLLLRGLFGTEHLVPTDEIRPLLEEAVAKLNERDAKVLRLRFGLNGPRHTLEEVGAIFGVNRQRAHQVEAQALRRIRFTLARSEIWKLLEPQLDKGQGLIEDEAWDYLKFTNDAS